MDDEADGAPGPRELLLRAVIDEVAERGYGVATADRISERAGVPHAVFLDLFGEKQTCFLAAYRGWADDLIAHVTVPIENAPGYLECVQAGPSLRLETNVASKDGHLPAFSAAAPA